MRKAMLIALVTALMAVLCGCQDTGEVENQAYVLVLAMDQAEDGGLTLTARVPRIGKSEAKSDKGGEGGNPYLNFSVSAPSWSRALEALQWATPRRINLSHIEMIVASETLASRPTFPALMNDVADTPHLYTNARFVVCSGNAKAFLEAGDTVIGTRLSSEIHAMLSQYARQGYIPDACLADAWYSTNGIYGDAIAIWACLDGPNEMGSDAPAAESPMRQRFYGTALFREGRFVVSLSPDETRLLKLIRGHGDAIPYAWQGRTVSLAPESQTRKRVMIDGDNVTLALSARLSVPDGIADEEIPNLEASVRDDITRLINLCQQLGCDPFGYAETAAGHFPTVPQWAAFDWRSHYQGARLNIDVALASSRTNP